MAVDFIQLPIDGAGKKVQTRSYLQGSDTVHSQAGFMVDGSGNPAAVKNSNASSSDYGMVTRPFDAFSGGETLADQTGTGAVLTFTFSSAVNLVVVEAKGTSQTARADPFGGTPTASQGVICDDAVPTFLPVTATIVKVFAPSGMVVGVWGYRY